jgi:rhomboid protease GluP
LTEVGIQPLRIEWAPTRGRRPIPPIEFAEDALRLPRFTRLRWVISVPYTQILEARLSERGRRVILGVRGRLPLSYRSAALARAGDAALLVDELKRRIGSRERGAEQLEALEYRAALAHSTVSIPWVSLASVGLIFAFFAMQLAARATTWDPAHMVRLGANSPLLVARGELDRLVTGNLLHGGLGHLLVNALVLLGLGAQLEPLLGRLRFGLVLVASALGGAGVSSLIAAAQLSIGASTAVFGLLGALTYLNLRRRQELHAGLLIPPWLAVGAIALQFGFEFLVPGIDHAAHLGGFTGGACAAAFALAGRRLLDLRSDVPAHLRVVALGAVLVFGLGLVRGVLRVLRPDPHSDLTIAEYFLREGGAHAFAVNNMAMRIAVSPAASSDQLQLAREAIDGVVQALPTAAFVWDTMAAVQHRQGQLVDAIASQRRACGLDPSVALLATLASYQDEQLRAHGVLKLEDTDDLQPVLEWVPPDPEADLPAALTLRTRVPAAVPTLIHALAYEGEAPVLHIEIALAVGAGEELRFGIEHQTRPLLQTLQLRVVLIDTHSLKLPGGTAAMRLRALPGADPERSRGSAPATS